MGGDGAVTIEQEKITRSVHTFNGEPGGECQTEITSGWFCLKASDDMVHLKTSPRDFPVSLPAQHRGRNITPPEYLKAKAGAAYQTYTGSLTVDDPATTLQGALVFFDQCARLIAQKNEAYGDAWRAQGWTGNVSRILSKAKRVETMLWRDEPVTESGGESIAETLKDLANLCYFAARNLEEGNRWGE